MVITPFQINIDNLPEIMGLEPVMFQIMMFVICFFVGVMAIVIYTAYSFTVVKFVKPKFAEKFLLPVCDIVFWLVYALFVFILYYNINNAKFRVFYFIIMLLGLLTAYNIKIFIYKKHHLTKKTLPK